MNKYPGENEGSTVSNYSITRIIIFRAANVMQTFISKKFHVTTKDMKAVVCFDGSDSSKSALEFALNFKDTIDHYYILYVKPAIMAASTSFESYTPASAFENQEEVAAALAGIAEKTIGEHKDICEFVSVDSGGQQVSSMIVKFAEEKGVDIIFTGTRKLGGLSKVILGSVSSEIVKQSKIPVLVCPGKKTD